MARKKSVAPLILLLVVLALVGIAANVLVFLDLPWLRALRTAPNIRTEAETDVPPELREETVEGIREAVYLVQLPRCDGQGLATGTAFLIHDGYAVTCSHVVGDNLSCGSEIRVVDSEGTDQVAALEAYSNPDDLALLRLTATEAPRLPLAESSQYEESEEVLRVFTIGYPLVGAASTAERASFSGVGTISQFDRSRGVFITSGLNLNPGNSGGPVVFEHERLILGVACSGVDRSVAEGIAYVIPSNRVKEFFSAKTGQTLP